MLYQIKQIVYKQFIKLQINRFIIIGIISTLINFTTYYILVNFANSVRISSLIGYIAGLINSYYFGKRWVFSYKNKTNINSITKFTFIYLIGGLVMTTIITKSYNLGIDYKISWFFGTLFSTINNFLGCKYFVFKSPKKKIF